MEKYCPECSRTLSIDGGFHKNRRRHDGVQSICKDCSNTRRRQYSKDNRAKQQKGDQARYWARYYGGTDDYRKKINLKKSTRARKAQITPAGEEYVDLIKNDPCVYCGGPMEHVDHIHPLSKGGDSDWVNLAPSCASCNTSKSDKGVLQFMLGRV